MSDATEIEKKSLEAHVELCAERYRFLEEKLDSLEEKISSVVSSISSVKNTIEVMAVKNNDRIITWGIGIIGVLIAACAYLLTHYVFK
jgi:uncharacterized membrane protein YqhA